MSFVEVDLLGEDDEFELDPTDATRKRLFVSLLWKSKNGYELGFPDSPRQGYQLWRYLIDLTNSVDDLVEHGKLGREDREFYKGVRKQFSGYVTKISGHYKNDPSEFRPNKRPNRGSEARQERRHRFFADVEAQYPEYLPLAIKLEWKLPKDTEHQSRFEKFIEYAQSDEGEALNAILAEELSSAQQKRLGKAQLAHYEQIRSELTPEDRALLEEIAEWSEPEEEIDEYGGMEHRFEDFLSEKELRMLEAVVNRELAESDGRITRTIKAFYVTPRKRKAKPKNA